MASEAARLSTRSKLRTQMTVYQRPVGEELTGLQDELRELLLRALPDVLPETTSTLVDTARVRRVQPGDLIYEQGEPSPLTLIMHGYAAARRTMENGHVLVTGVAPAGVVFGYSGIAGTQSSVEFVAVTDVVVAQWPGPDLRPLASSDSGLALAAIDSLATSLHAMMERIEGFLHQDARRRVLRVLARDRELFFGEPAVLNRSHLHGLVGTSREMTGRVLRQLEREKIVARVGRVGLRLLRPDILSEGRS
jgi:CRP-like cAMP-binding protein